MITSLQNPLVKHLVKLRQNRDYRYEQQSALVEGIKQITELCREFTPKCVLALEEGIIPKNIKGDLVSDAVMKKISGVPAPEGLVAEFPLPKPSNLTGIHRLVAFDGINDPGNLGTLLRTALALGWEGAYLIGECCDPFNEKALRAGKGAAFRLPIGCGTAQNLQKIAKKNGLKPFAADIEGIPIGEIDMGDGVLLVLGNEAHGISPEIKVFCQPATIPLSGKMESLNVAVAGGILMHHMRKR